MPKKGRPKVSSAKRVSIVVEKETAAEKSHAMIAADHNVSRPVVTKLGYEVLTDEEKEMYRQQMADLPYESAGMLMTGVRAMRQLTETAMAQNDPKYLSGVASATKAAMEVHLRSTGQATQVVEHRSPVDAAKAAMQRIMDTGKFTEENVPEVIDIVARKYNVDKGLLE